jgi:hypothetical protein
MPKKKAKLRLAPIGDGSDAHEHGYYFDLLFSWLENIRDHELERPHRKYVRRARAFSDAVDALQEAADMEADA